MNNSLPYEVTIEATRPGYNPVNFDIKIGGLHYHKSDQVELGQFPFVKLDNRSKFLIY